MKTGMRLLATLGVGAAVAYLLDPDRGRRRRAIARQRLASVAHDAGGALDATSRDVAHRTRGIIAGIQSRLHAEAPVTDDVLVARVRSRLGGVTAHPRAIEVGADHGRIVLRGPILADEVERVVTRVAAVRGVRAVENALEPHETGDGVPALQGGGRPGRGGDRFALRPEQWAPARRLAAGLAGALLTRRALRRGGLGGIVLGLGGALLVGRSVTNRPLVRLAEAPGLRDVAR